MSGLCAITGATGTIGSACARLLREEGTEVLRLVRRPEGAEKPFVLGEEVDPGILKGADSLIHCAYDFQARGWEEIRRSNVEGSLRLFEAARSAGVRRIVFVSTVSAFEGCKSLYGKGKLAVEDPVRRDGGTVFRPGLVYGAPGKGIFGALSRLTRLPLLPVFDGGTQPFVLVHVEDLARALSRALEADKKWNGSLVTAAHPDTVSFKEILRTIARKKGKKLRTISVPSCLGLAGLKTLEAVGLRPGFRSDSLVSLINPDPAMDFTDARRFGLEFRPFKDVSPEDL